jgi:hypothetical protein
MKVTRKGKHIFIRVTDLEADALSKIIHAGHPLLDDGHRSGHWESLGEYLAGWRVGRLSFFLRRSPYNGLLRGTYGHYWRQKPWFIE